MTGQLPKTKIKKYMSGVVNARLMSKGLLQMAKGELRFSKGHIPPSKHQIPRDYVGLSITASDDPNEDEYILARIKELNIKSVRVDVSYGDVNNKTGRLLQKLLDAQLQVMIRLVQPPEDAYAMGTAPAQQTWREFVKTVCDRYGRRVYAIEVGSAINLKQRAGYNSKGFFAAWDIAHEEIKARGIALAGPNISGFDPLFKFSVLHELADMAMLPDIHTNSLFPHHIHEPESDDLRVLGIGWAAPLKMNLVKMARLLGRHGNNSGVSRFIAPDGYWDLDGIDTLLTNAEQKQADYLTRYLTLLAASGALEKTFWGSLLCERGGLIDDGNSKPYTQGRVSHSSDKKSVNDFRIRPAYRALKQFIAAIPGAQYEGALSTNNNVEIHAFRKGKTIIHVAWTVNGKACPIDRLYNGRDLQVAGFKDRDGNNYKEHPRYITEAPTFIFWGTGYPVALKTAADKIVLESVFCHQQHGRYYPVNNNGWRGMLVATNKSEAQSLVSQLHPVKLAVSTHSTRQTDANRINWKINGPQGKKLIAHKPLKMAFQEYILDFFKPSMARRYWIAAAELSRRGIAVAQPVAYFEKTDDSNMLQNIYISEQVDHDFNAQEMLTAYRDGAQTFHGISATSAYKQFAHFLLSLHKRGVFVGNLTGSDVLIKQTSRQQMAFTLSDIHHARFHDGSTPVSQRLSDLSHFCQTLDEQGRDYLVGHYLNNLPKPGTFQFYYRFALYLFDLKLKFKRRHGNKS